MQKIGILYICTGKYDIFWKDFYLSCEKYLLNDTDETGNKKFEKHYFVWTDAKEIFGETENKNIKKVYQEDLGWPGNTLMRFDMFLGQKESLKEMDYIFFFNANCLILENINEKEFLPDINIGEKLLAVLHPYFLNKKRRFFTYENKNINSLAYIKKNEGNMYFMGALNGGFTKSFLEAVEIMDKNTKTDLDQNIIARFHDESHWNRYLVDRDDIKVLEPEYLYPENYNVQFLPKIFLRNKDQFGDLNTIRNLKLKLSKSIFKKIYYLIRNKIIYSLFKIYDKFIFTNKRIFRLKEIKSKDQRKISVVITYFNRHETIHKALYNILNDDRVAEILIVDDCSKLDSYEYLKNFVSRLGSEKMRIIRNKINLGMFKNKLYALSQAKYDWSILLDSDNTLQKSYIDSIYKINNWDVSTMYCPSFSWPLLNNETLSGKEYLFKDIRELLIHNSRVIKQFLNLGNFFVNKKEFFDSTHNMIDFIPYAADSIYINYLWTAKGNRLFIPNNCRYIHRVNGDSTWKIQSSNSVIVFENIKNAFLMSNSNLK